MSTRHVYLLCCLLVLSTTGAAWGDLVGYWTLDEGGGAKAADSSGKGNDGTIMNKPAWIAGVQGSALEFHGLGAAGGGGDYITIPHSASLDITSKISIALWIKPGADDPEGKGTETAPMAKADQNASPSWSYQVRYGWGGAPQPNMAFTFNTSPRAWAFVGRKLVRNEWCHIACSHDGTTLKCYVNGVQTDSTAMGAITSSPTPTLIGSDGWGCDWIGAIDDVRVYNHPITPAEIKEIMSGPAKLASTPQPADKAVDVPRDASLGWKPGVYAVTHDVYVGQTVADVNNASRAKPAGLLVSQDQTATSYAPAALLAYGQTYYWRVDEVNKAPDNTIYKGNIWSFTVEPYGYPITKVTATASTFQLGMGPENTINGSGMTGDLHGNDPMTMWMSRGTLPNWIQYEFDQVYKLWDLKVWNSNQSVESYVGFGARKVTVEYSADGTTWKALDNVPEFGRGTGLPGYAANTTVNFGGVQAKFVKLTINQTWGGMSTVTGLSEVRFSYVPVQAFTPEPATGAADTNVGATLTWRPGREAASHKVFFGTDQAAVTNGTATAKSVTSPAFDPGALTYGTKYYWRVDEVNAVTYPGEVWSFTTQEFVAIDDFESYNDDDNCIYDTWIDGYTDKKSGSQVGYLNAPFAEQMIIHGGKQSMPMSYDNSKSPFYSETTREFDTAQDWTGNGATHLDLWFRGYPALNVAVTETAGKMTLTGDGTDIWNNSDDFVFAYKTLTGDGSIIARVVSVGTGSNTWAKGGVMIRSALTGGATFVNTVITGGGGNGASFQYRLTANGACGNTDAAAAITAPYWVKIERKGNTITGSLSANGTTWTQLGTPQTLVMTGPAYIGLCVCSHQAGEQRTMQFDGIATAGGVSGSWQGAQISGTQHNDAAGLYVVVEDSAGGKKLVAHPDPAATATATWTQWKVPFSDLTGVKMNKVKKLTLGAGDRNSPKAGGTGMLYIDDIGYGHPLP